MASLAGGPGFRQGAPDLLINGPEPSVSPLATPDSPAARVLTGSGDCGLPVDL
jgi:hypothetical protein